jgi:hypothetical protein
MFGVIAKYNRKSLAFGIPGLLLQSGSLVAIAVVNYTSASAGHPPEEWISNLLSVGYYGGTILLIVGLCEYADAKGRNRLWALLGAVSLVGLVILACLEDKTKDRNF